MEQKIDLLVSFDTTGSMYPVLAQVRREVEQFVKTMFSDFTDLRLGIIAHGDYCDKDNPYTIRVMDFTRDEKRLCEFVRETKPTYGGDADECYELVLHTAHNDLQWREDAEHVLLMIGDASPHAPSYPQNKLNLDWKEEADKLRKLGIKVFSVHALAGYRSSSRAFYKTVAETTGGIYLTLDMFNEIVDLIKATCYQQGGEEKLNEFVTIIKDSGKMTRSMENNFKRLRGEEVEDTYETYRASRGTGMSYKGKKKTLEDVTLKEMGKLVPVIPGRFQIMTVDENCAIKQFVENNGIKFKIGRGFYELSKAETVQQYKEVIMMDRETGEMFNGSQVREELGLQPQSEKGGVKERLHKDATKKFRVFVQSTSVNRKLIAGTTFLYEVDDLEDTGTVIEEVEIKSTGDIKTPVKVEKKSTKKTSKKTEKESKDVVDKIYTAKSKKEVREIVADCFDKASRETTEKTVSDACDAIVAAEVMEEVLDKKETKSKDKISKKAEIKDTPVFSDLKSSGYFKTVKIEEKAKKVKVKSYNLDKIDSQLEKAKDGVNRYKKSTNKKNTIYLKNNLEKLIKDAQNLLESL